MYKLDRSLFKVILAVVFTTTIASASFLGNMFGNTDTATNKMDGHNTIDGAVYHPVKDGKTGPYHINEDTLRGGYSFGRVPTANELEAWDRDVMPDGTGLPEGEGSVEAGEEIYEAQCMSCHGDFGSGGGGYPSLSKGNAYEMQKTLKNQRSKPDAEGPVRVFGSYWPEASTLFWYIRDGMPHPRSKTLSTDEVYALCAYVLNINEIEIDGALVDDEYVLNREKFLKIKMPNKDGFEPNIDGPNALNDVREYYSNPANFGGIKTSMSSRCMHDCQKDTTKIVRVTNGGISDFHPPLSSKKDLPNAKKVDHNENPFKKVYENNCAMCHADDSMGAPVAGSKEDWDARLSNGGIEGVYSRGISGVNAMPPKGGSSLSDDDFKKVVDYLIKLK
jgi:cytochrome c